MSTGKKLSNGIIITLLSVLTVVYLYPIFFILNNSFKGRFFISRDPFGLPTEETFVGLENYIVGLQRTGFFEAMGWSFFITVFSVLLIITFTSMTAYYITRVKNRLTSSIYMLFVFSMVVPFQMVMFTMSSFADRLSLNNPIGMGILNLGFGSGLAVFMFSGFVKSIPLEIEEASYIDGCGPIRNFFLIVFPILKPTAITVAILQTMWVWNDFFLPYLVIGLSTRYKTIPVVVQVLIGSNGMRDMGAMMAMLVLAILPIIIFYLFCQKHIVDGVIAGAVKG